MKNGSEKYQPIKCLSHAIAPSNDVDPFHGAREFFSKRFSCSTGSLEAVNSSAALLKWKDPLEFKGYFGGYFVSWDRGDGI